MGRGADGRGREETGRRGSGVEERGGEEGIEEKRSKRGSGAGMWSRLRIERKCVGIGGYLQGGIVEFVTRFD